MSSKYSDGKTRELLRALSKMLTKPDLILFLGNVFKKLLFLKLLIPKKAPKLLIAAAVSPTIYSAGNTLPRPMFHSFLLCAVLCFVIPPPINYR